ncbi:MAG: acetate kinase, partial [Pseudomonadota bacterium]
LVLSALTKRGFPVSELGGVGHRVVHGGAKLNRPEQITTEVRDIIEACVPLAPLHNPHHLNAIERMAQAAPDLLQVACFDTAFHVSQPDVARAYALPQNKQTAALQRYGFHGNSYAALVDGFQDATGQPLPRRLLALHLGNGASLCAIRDGMSVATTMGYSPVSGVPMGTRSGDIDATAVLTLAEAMGTDRARSLLTEESGLLGLSGISPDMRTLEASDAPEAAFAIEHFCYWIIRHAGSLIAAMQGLDAIAFTGGIGENAEKIRKRILDGLTWLGPFAHYVVPAREEAYIAQQTLKLLQHRGAHV